MGILDFWERVRPIIGIWSKEECGLATGAQPKSVDYQLRYQDRPFPAPMEPVDANKLQRLLQTPDTARL